VSETIRRSNAHNVIIEIKKKKNFFEFTTPCRSEDLALDTGQASASKCYLFELFAEVFPFKEVVIGAKNRMKSSLLVNTRETLAKSNCSLESA
jgi:hypothetical protein